MTFEEWFTEEFPNVKIEWYKQHQPSKGWIETVEQAFNAGWNAAKEDSKPVRTEGSDYFETVYGIDEQP